MRFAMVENALIFVIHNFLATTVGIAATAHPLEFLVAPFDKANLAFLRDRVAAARSTLQ